MGKDPKTSVVDEFGRPHDVPNLIIVDGNVMVTGGAVKAFGANNPAAFETLSLLAGGGQDFLSSSKWPHLQKMPP